jgi:general secretion pathway protein D
MIIPDERTNQLIIVASERTYLQVLELIRALDTPLGDADGEIRVHKLQNADAEEMASTLSQLSSKTKAATTKAGAKAGAKAPAAKASAGAASLFEGEVQVTAHKATNSLIIVGSARDYMSLKTVIDELDLPRKQVFVEAVIMEVGLSGTRHLGFAFHGGTDFDVQNGDTTETGLGILGTAFSDSGGNLSSLLLDPSMLQGLALGIQGPEITDSDNTFGISIPAFGVVMQALQTSSDVNTLSTPHILALDNEEAEIDVGQNVPVSTSFASGVGALSGLLNRATGSTAAGTAASSMGSLFPQMSIGREDVGVRLTITPHINQFDQVRMDIEVEVSEIADESDLGPIIGQRIAKTKCVMADQQTVVLGGLVTDKLTQAVSKVPVLGDIPVLGRLFKRTTKRTEKRNLLIFLTPYIIRDNTDFRRIFARKMQERREFIDRFTAFEYHEVQPDIDYDRTNGMLEEMNRAIAQIEAQEAAQRALESQQTPTHEPRRPVGEVSPQTVEAYMNQGGDEIDIEPVVARPFRNATPAPPPPPSIAPEFDQQGDTEVEE